MKKVVMLFFAAVMINFTLKAQNSSEVSSEIEKNSEMMKQAMQNGDFEKFGSYFAEDVMFKMSGQPALIGREAVISAHKPMAEQKMKLLINTDEVLDLGNYAHEIGSYEIHTPDGQKVDHGQYSTLWKKTNEGWKIYRDVISSSAGAAH